MKKLKNKVYIKENASVYLSLNNIDKLILLNAF